MNFGKVFFKCCDVIQELVVVQQFQCFLFGYEEVFEGSKEFELKEKKAFEFFIFIQQSQCVDFGNCGGVEFMTEVIFGVKKAFSWLLVSGFWLHLAHQKLVARG